MLWGKSLCSHGSTVSVHWFAFWDQVFSECNLVAWHTYLLVLFNIRKYLKCKSCSLLKVPLNISEQKCTLEWLLLFKSLELATSQSWNVILLMRVWDNQAMKANNSTVYLWHLVVLRDKSHYNSQSIWSFDVRKCEGTLQKAFLRE